MSIFYIRDVQQTAEQIANLTQYELFDLNIHCMRKSLFKYYSNTVFTDADGKDHNYSIDALQNNTVYLSVPSGFDDPYDCNICIDGNDFARKRIQYYASLCGVEVIPEWDYEKTINNLAIRIYEHIKAGGTVDTLFERCNDNQLVNAHQEYFQLMLQKELLIPDGEGYYRAINAVINQEYQEIQQTANRFRISCFAETPYSMLMWSHYAHYHQGFCIEYETPDYSDDNADLYHNLFPVIYTDTRTDLTNLSLSWKATGTLSTDALWDFYKYGLLCKSIDWKYQNEWRFVSCDNLLTDSSYNCRFFKIKKVYIGNRMPPEDRIKIIQICKDRGIPYAGVTIASDRFMMNDCAILCEDCEKVKQFSIKTIEIPTPGSIPPDKQEQYEALKARYTQLTEKQTRTDADREEMARLVEEAKELEDL